MAEQAKEHTTIAAPVEECFDTLTDFESYPEWAGDLKQATIVERDDDDVVLWSSTAWPRWAADTTYRLRYDYSGAPNRLGWHLDTGDIQRELDGAYELQPAEDDADATDVSYELSIDLIMPIPGFVKRRAEARILKTALDELKARERAPTPKSDGAA